MVVKCVLYSVLCCFALITVRGEGRAAYPAIGGHGGENLAQHRHARGLHRLLASDEELSLLSALAIEHMGPLALVGFILVGFILAGFQAGLGVGKQQFSIPRKEAYFAGLLIQFDRNMA